MKSKKRLSLWAITFFLTLHFVIDLQAQTNSISETGKVGIGTTSPISTLDVRTTEAKGTPVAIFNNTFGDYSREVEDNRPFVIKRSTGSKEAVYTFIQDAEAIYEYRNDEGSNRMVFRLVNTDTETGGGLNANRNEVLILHGNKSGGGVSIGTSNLPNGFRFSVDGKILAEEIQIKLSQSWPDYVFKKGFQLRNLHDLEKFIQENGHLPEIPSEEEVKENGISVGEMNAKLLQKIEELTLYVLDLKKTVDSQNERINELEN